MEADFAGWVLLMDAADGVEPLFLQAAVKESKAQATTEI
jgi:hypothetical protein